MSFSVKRGTPEVTHISKALLNSLEASIFQVKQCGPRWLSGSCLLLFFDVTSDFVTQRVHVPNNQVLGFWIIVVIV